MPALWVCSKREVNVCVSVQKTVPSVLKTIRSTPDMLDEYREEFGGFLGPVLHAAVIKSRQVQTSVAHPATPSSSNPFKPGNVAFSQVTEIFIPTLQHCIIGSL